ncbi:peptidoglycan DD-metalloendopeptidase family protein [Deinococcus aquiradiocola]|nr:peptidoglycan DD-metalloendopeptidase family protein [Deinococcus aquiradiocola]
MTLSATAHATSPVLEHALPQVTLRAPGLTLPAHVAPTRPGAVYVVARAGDTAQAIADSYGVDVSALSTARPGPLPAGAVVAVSLRNAVTEDGQLPPGVQVYTVQEGDTMAGVAARHGLSVTELLSANLSRETLDRLSVGERLFIPDAPGLLVRIKDGQTVQGLTHAYRADPARVALANGIGLPNELHVGDYLLLPGVIATGFRDQLIARQERQKEAARQARVQAQYEKYLAYQDKVKTQKLKRQYAIQEQYEKYLAYQKSPQRQALIAKYEAQARYDAAQRAAALQARAVASAPRGSTVRAASSGSVGGGLIWPLRSYRITSRFGEEDIEFHKEFFHGGVDLAAPYGTPIYSAASGTVTESGYGAFGNNVYTDTGEALIIYGHMSRTAVSVGQHVQRGDVLGYVGCSGMCTGPHLHFEVRLGGRPVNPLGLLP